MAMPGTPPPGQLVRRLEQSRRIHIVGGPGTGKSTLALQLGDTLGLPVHPLDAVAYEGIEYALQPASYCRAQASEIAATDRWVTEGIFAGWTEPLLERADTILWLDHAGWRRAATRIVLRAARSAGREVAVRRGRERFLRFADYRRNARQLFLALRDSRDFWGSPAIRKRRYPVTRTEVAESLAPYAAKVVRLSRNEHVVEVSAELEVIKKDLSAQSLR